MSTISTGAFATASNPAIENLGRVAGMALGKLVKGGENLLVEGLGMLGLGKESAAMGMFAKASKVMTQVFQSTGKMPFAGPELEKDADGKPKNPSASKAFGKGITARAAPQVPKGKPPGFTPSGL